MNMMDSNSFLDTVAMMAIRNMIEVNMTKRILSKSSTLHVYINVYSLCCKLTS